MSEKELQRFTGVVTEVFGHRFTVKTDQGTMLADIGPKAAETIELEIDDHVDMKGEVKPSEVKVIEITINSGKMQLAHGADKHALHHDEEADPAAALKTAKSSGYTVLGEPRRKPKHFEILGRSKSGVLTELHIELDGQLRKHKPVEANDHKWQDEIAASR